MPLQMLEKTNHDTAEYNRQVEDYKTEYEALTQKVDERENIVDSMPEDF